MYIQITTRCNMSCAHCGYSCTKHGEDMSMDVFRAAAKEAWGRGDVINLGGGEPTLHPRFWEMLGLALGYSEDQSPWLATNGSVTETAVALAGIAKRGAMGVALSIDSYHDAVDRRVLQAFDAEGFVPGDDLWAWRQRHGDRDLREIRCNDGSLSDSGRAKDNGIGVSDKCLCNDIVVVPDGTVYACGCQHLVLGNVLDGNLAELPDGFRDYDCSSEYARGLREDGEEGDLDMDELVQVFGPGLVAPSRIGARLLAGLEAA